MGQQEGQPERVFVYGTLMPGRLRWPHLATFARARKPASAPGRLFDSGRGWPLAVFDAEPAGSTVPGVAVELDRHRNAEALALLDEVEGVAHDLFARVVVRLDDGHDAWAYHWHGRTDGLERLERWDERPEA